MSTEAMKLALAALDDATIYTSSESWSPSMTDECNRAADALRRALSAQPPAKPHYRNSLELTHPENAEAFERLKHRILTDREFAKSLIPTFSDEDQEAFENQPTFKPQPPAPSVPTDWHLRSKVADLLHLLEFSAISSATGGDDVQAQRVMAELRAMLSAAPPPVRERLTPEQIYQASNLVPLKGSICTDWFEAGARWAERALIGGDIERATGEAQ